MKVVSNARQEPQPFSLEVHHQMIVVSFLRTFFSFFTTFWQSSFFETPKVGIIGFSVQHLV